MLADVLLLSRIAGAEVVGADGAVMGRLADLTVRLDGNSGPQTVARLLVSRRGAPAVLLSWDVVTNVHCGRPVLADGAVGASADELYDDEIRLARDVLDTQVVDLAGQRLARVADVVLARTADSRLEVCGVEVGFGGVLRRLGLGRLVPRSTEDVVAWSDLHLTSERGHAVQLSAPRAAVHRLDARSLAALVSRVDTDSATEILAVKEPSLAAEVVAAASPEVGERVLRAMPAALAGRIVAAMSHEHAGRWRARLARRPRLWGRPLLRSRVWPHRRHLVRNRHR
jgi:sporulation protein YlmC with PRC-barrel domain